jgi:outer membrane protein
LKAAAVAGVVLSWAVAGVVSQPLPVAADTMDQALAKAYQNNPQLNSQRAVVRETDESVPQALSGYKPRVTVTGSTGHEYTSNLAKSTTGVPSYNRTDTGYTPSLLNATAQQTLFNGFQTANRTRLAESNTSAARETLRVAEQTILMNAATAYMDLIRDAALLELQRRNVEVLQEQLRQTRDRFIVGEVTRTDVAQAETFVAMGRAMVLNAEASYARSKATYRQVIGVEATTLVPAAPVDRLSPRRLNEAIDLGRARHPNVGVSMFGIDAAVLQVKVTEGTLYPVVTLTGTVQQTWETAGSGALTTALQQFNAFVLGQITVPIYQGGAEYSLIRQAKETLGQRRIDLETTRDAVQANIVTTWGALEASKASVLANNAQVASASIALEGVREEARVGQRTTFDVLQAQQILVNARTSLVSAQHDRIVASYALLASVGELNLPKLGILIPLYDPMVHYQQVRDAWIGVRTPDGR